MTKSRNEQKSHTYLRSQSGLMKIFQRVAVPVPHEYVVHETSTVWTDHDIRFWGAMEQCRVQLIKDSVSFHNLNNAAILLSHIEIQHRWKSRNRNRRRNLNCSRKRMADTKHDGTHLDLSLFAL